MTRTRLADFDAAAAAEEIDECGIVTIPYFLHDYARWKLLEELGRHTLTKAPKVVGPFKVRQDYTRLEKFPPGSYFLAIRDRLQANLNEKFGRLDPSPLSAPLVFNNNVVQRYQPVREGISPHRDGKSMINIVAVLVLEGRGRFCVCETRSGRNPIEIQNNPGDLLLMRGPGFLGSQKRPLHFVDRITRQRTTFGMRHDKRIKE